MCVHPCGGQKTTLGVILQVPTILVLFFQEKIFKWPGAPHVAWPAGKPQGILPFLCFLSLGSQLHSTMFDILESDTVGLKLWSSRLHASPLRTEIALYPPSYRSLLLFPNTLAQLRWTQGFPHYAPWNHLVFEMTSW